MCYVRAGGKGVDACHTLQLIQHSREQGVFRDNFDIRSVLVSSCSPVSCRPCGVFTWSVVMYVVYVFGWYQTLYMWAIC